MMILLHVWFASTVCMGFLRAFLSYAGLNSAFNWLCSVEFVGSVNEL